MSLILEALKKSEARRRLGNAPDLDTPFTTAKPQRGLLPYLVVAIVIVAGAGWWLLRRPATPIAPTTNATPASHAPTRQTPAATTQHSISGAAKPARNANTTVPHDSSPWVAAQRPELRQTMRETREERRRRRLERQTAAANGSTASDITRTHLGAAPARAPAAEPSQSLPHERSSAAQPASQWVATGPRIPMARHPAPPATQSAPGNAAPDPISRPSAATSTSPPASTPTPMVAGPGVSATKPAHPIEPATAPTEVPPYYQLAYDVRKALPALKLSMHVYSADPAARFVILNDSRMTEGEKTPDDVTLEKIVPDGVILEFQGHRFFFPRDAL